ncbi:flagellar hook-associated protein 2 [Bacillota bacterium LX-D]|nr:flagellar hook-associated protein 2 [Bacillota bacterium LX-D]
MVTSLTSSSSSRIVGLASGMDIDQMVSDLMKAARKPLDKLYQEKTLKEWKKEDYRTMNTQLLALRTEASNMRLQGTYLARKASSSDESVVTATSANNATTATYSIKITNLATSTIVQSSSDISNIDPTKKISEIFTDVTGEFSFSINGQEFTVDPANKTLNSFLNEISSNSKAGVTAFFASSGTNQGKIVLMSKSTGSTSSINLVDSTNSFLTGKLGLNTTTPGSDATVTINGIETKQSSNIFTINGTTFTLKGKLDTVSTVSVVQDSDAIYNSIKSFVDKYNDVIDKLNTEVREKRYRDYAPLTSEQKEDMKDEEIKLWEEKAKSGMLRSDPILTNCINKMRFNWSQTVSFTGVNADYNQMSEFGINTGSYVDEDGNVTLGEEGKLIIDEAKLKKAINEHPQEVIDFFTKTSDTDNESEMGVAQRLYRTLNTAINDIIDQAGISNSLSQYDNSYLAKAIEDLDERIDAKTESLNDLEDYYYSKFTAMETAIQKYNTQSAWLSQQFSS